MVGSAKSATSLDGPRQKHDPGGMRRPLATPGQEARALGAQEQTPALPDRSMPAHRARPDARLPVRHGHSRRSPGGRQEQGNIPDDVRAAGRAARRPAGPALACQSDAHPRHRRGPHRLRPDPPSVVSPRSATRYERPARGLATLAELAQEAGEPAGEAPSGPGGRTGGGDDSGEDGSASFHGRRGRRPVGRRRPRRCPPHHHAESSSAACGFVARAADGPRSATRSMRDPLAPWPRRLPAAGTIISAAMQAAAAGAPTEPERLAPPGRFRSERLRPRHGSSRQTPRPQTLCRSRGPRS